MLIQYSLTHSQLTEHFSVVQKASGRLMTYLNTHTKIVFVLVAHEDVKMKSNLFYAIPITQHCEVRETHKPDNYIVLVFLSCGRIAIALI